MKTTTTSKYGYKVTDGFVDLSRISLKLEFCEMDRDRFMAYAIGEILVGIGKGDLRGALHRVLYDLFQPWSEYQRAKNGYKE
jgi:hypothetical protein